MLFAIRHGVIETASDTHDWPVIATATTVLFAAFILTAFLNYTYDWPFTATAICLLAILGSFGLLFLSLIDKQWQFNPQNNNFAAFDIYASLLLLFAVFLLVAVAVMFSTTFNIVLTLTFCVGVFMLGLISDFVFGRFADVHLWAKIGKILTPNMQVFWISDAIYEGSAIPLNYVLSSAAYGLLYTSGILLLAIALFQRRQVG